MGSPPSFDNIQNPSGTCSPPLPSLEVSLAQETVGHPTIFQQSGEQLGRFLARTVTVAEHLYHRGATLASAGLFRAMDTAQDVGRQVQNHGQRIKQEHPFRLLTSIIGVAFVAGASIRVWRSRIS